MASPIIIKLYRMSCEKNVVDKTSGIRLVKQIQGTLREQCSLTNPSINIMLDNDAQDFSLFNYVQIEAFNRYYFVKNIISVNKNIWRMDLEVDVLMSYKNYILNHSALIDRQEFNYDLYLRDENVITKINPVVETIKCTYGGTGNLFTEPSSIAGDFDGQYRYLLSIIVGG